MSTLHHSATSIETYLACPMKWARIYRDGIRMPQTEAQKRGTRLHDVLQYIVEHDGNYPLPTHPACQDLTQADVDILEEARPLWQRFVGDPNVRCEGKFDFQTTRHTWTGRKDVVVLPAEVNDYKTTADIDQWAKTEEDLKTDPQALLYAEEHFRKHPELDALDLVWIYMQTKGQNKSETRHLKVLREDAARGFAALEHIADLCEGTPDSATAPQNQSRCDDFRGCQFKGANYCNISPFSRKPDMSAAEDLFKMMASGRAAAGVPPVVVPPSSLVPAEVANAAPPPLKTATSEVVFNESWSQAPHTPQAINPPAPPVAIAPVVHVGSGTAAMPGPNTPPAPPPMPEAVRRRTKDEIARNLTPEEAAKERAAKATPPAAAPALATLRERVTGVPTPPPAPPAAPPTPLAAPAVTTPATLAKESAVELRIRTLYINCRPVGRPLTEFDIYVALARKQLAAGGLADYRLGEFGKGQAYFLESVIGMLARGPAEQDVFIDTTTPEGRLCVAHLRAAAADVVQAVAA